jgi:hypothetical protein
MEETTQNQKQTFVRTLLLLLIVFVSSFVSLCIPLGQIEWLRPLISTLLFSSAAYITQPPDKISSSPNAARNHHIQNSMKMYIGSVIAGSQATIRTPLITTGSFALLTGLDNLWERRSQLY